MRIEEKLWCYVEGDEGAEGEGSGAPVAGAPGGEAPGTTEGGEGTAAAPAGATIDPEALEESIRERFEEWSAPMRERLLNTQAELIALKAKASTPAAPEREEPPAGLNDQDLLKRLAGENPIPAIRDIVMDIIERNVRPQLEATKSEIGRNTSLQQTLVDERNRAIRDFGLDKPENEWVFHRAGEIYQGKVKAGLAYQGMIYEAAELANAEALRLGKVKAPTGNGGPPTPKARTPLRGITLTPPSKSPEERNGDLLGEMGKEFSQDELQNIQGICKRSGVTLTKWWQRFQEEKKANPLYGLRSE